ncbi:MAG: thioesterase family protein [Pseudomonadota bacterium]
MFPFFRTGLELWLHRNKPMGIFDTHVSHHTIRLWDMDIFAELNNGRTLTVFDIGRVTLALRTGLIALLRREKWGLTLAGNSVRYRRRVRAFQRVETKVRLIGWDDRFLYIEHAMFRKGQCTSHVLVRGAITDGAGLVTMDRVLSSYGYDGPSPELPGWVQAWVAAEDKRPWPPFED